MKPMRLLFAVRDLLWPLLAVVLGLFVIAFVVFNPALRTVEVRDVFAAEVNQLLPDGLAVPQSAQHVSVEAREYCGPAYYMRFAVDHNARDRLIQDTANRLNCRFSPVAKE